MVKENYEVAATQSMRWELWNDMEKLKRRHEIEMGSIKSKYENELRERDLRHVEELGRHIDELKELHCNLEQQQQRQQQEIIEKEERHQEEHRAALKLFEDKLRHKNQIIESFEKQRNEYDLKIDQLEETIRKKDKIVRRRDKKIKILNEKCCESKKQLRGIITTKQTMKTKPTHRRDPPTSNMKASAMFSMLSSPALSLRTVKTSSLSSSSSMLLSKVGKGRKQDTARNTAEGDDTMISSSIFLSKIGKRRKHDTARNTVDVDDAMIEDAQSFSSLLSCDHRRRFIRNKNRSQSRIDDDDNHDDNDDDEIDATSKCSSTCSSRSAILKIIDMAGNVTQTVTNKQK